MRHLFRKVMQPIALALSVTACAPIPALVSNNSMGITAQARNFTVLEGPVTQLLPDDLKGSRHQLFRFKTRYGIVQCAHNIDLAPYVPLKVGDHVRVKGVYLAQPKVIHWTHHDPKGGPGGWIEHDKKIYEKI